MLAIPTKSAELLRGHLARVRAAHSQLDLFQTDAAEKALGEVLAGIVAALGGDPESFHFSEEHFVFTPPLNERLHWS